MRNTEKNISRIKHVLFACLLLPLAFSLNVYAQVQHNNWCFPAGAGLNFSSNPPSVTTSSLYYNGRSAGCASISDPSGNLLFYTDGIEVFNGNNGTMANGTGLMGGLNVSHNIIILKKPGSNSLYYIITAARLNSATNFGGYNPNHGLRYSIVDMSLANNTGSVTAKNILLDTLSIGSIAYAKHCNGSDYWIISHDYNSSAFRIYQLTSTGINTTALVQNFGLTLGLTGFHMVASNSKKISILGLNNSPSNNSTICLIDFDNSTGVLSNFTTLNTSGGINATAFSPDCSKLYATVGAYNIDQFDLCAGSNYDIQQSRLSFTTSVYLADLQLATNGKIYVARYQQQFLGVINNPNALGSLCNYVDQGLSISPNYCRTWLPNFTPDFQKPPIPSFSASPVQSVCQTVTFQAPYNVGANFGNCVVNTYTVQNLSWNFGDPLSGSNNTSTLSNPTHYFTSAGTYTVKLIYNFGCGYGIDTLKQIVNVNNSCFSVSSNSITCASLGTATVNNIGNALGPFTYTWLPTNQNTAVAINLNPGTHTILIHDAASNITSTTTTTFVPLVPLSGNLSFAGSVTCNGAATGTAAYTNITGGSNLQVYTWSALLLSGLSTFTSNQGNIGNLSAGQWTSTVTDALTGCTINNNFVVTQPPALTLNISANTASACAGNSVALSATVSGGSPTYLSAWGNNNLSPFTSNASYPVLENIAGSYVYTLHVFDTYSCNINNTINIIFVPNPTITVSNQSICPLQTAYLTASGANSYTWTSATSTSTMLGSSTTSLGLPTSTLGDSPITSQQYTVTGASLGCSSAAYPSIIIKQTPNVVINTNAPVCEGSVLLLSCNSGTSYVWSGVNSFVSSNANNTITAVTLAANGIYNVTVTALNSCTAAASTTVVVKPLPVLSISPSTQSMCLGTQSVQLNALGTANTFSWFPSISLTNATGSSVIAHPTSNTNYTLIGSLNGCTNIAAGTVYVVPPPNLFVSLSSNSACAQALNGSMNTITLTSGGASSYSIVTPPQFHNQNPSGPTSTLSLLPPFYQSGAATATLYGSNGVCTLSTTAVFTIVPNPSVSVSNPTPVICAGQSYTYTNSGASSYTWSSATPGSSLYTTGNVAVANPSINSVFSVFGGHLGCNSAIQTVSITVNPLPKVYVSPSPTFICKGVPVALTALGDATSFTWQPSSWLSNNQSAVVQANPPQLQNYTVFASLNNCTNAAVASVSVMPLPSIGVGSNQASLCINQELTLQASGALQYQWQTPNMLRYTGQNIKITISDFSYAGNYTVTAADSNNCVGSNTIHIHLKSFPGGYIKNAQNNYCVPFNDVFYFEPNIAVSSNNSHYSWQINDAAVASTSSFAFTFLKPGIYTIKGLVTNDEACTNTIVSTITAMPKPEAQFNFIPLEPIENIDEVEFVANTKDTKNIVWTMGMGNNLWTSMQGEKVIQKFENAGIYPIALVVSNEFGCFDTLVKTIKVLPDLNIFVPNAFTPNGDNKNDLFKPVLRSAQSLHFVVYDRWGEKLFETSDLNAGWDGTFKGEECKDDVYVWKLSVKGLAGAYTENQSGHFTEEKNYTGQVLLVR